MDPDSKERLSLLTTESLHASSVVANCTMNRERQLRGPNSYKRDLGLDVMSLVTKPPRNAQVVWVDLCCGTGRALVAAAAELYGTPYAGSIRIQGIDLVGHFDPHPYPERLTLIQHDIENWNPIEPCRLITCVHGLHYVGDKLAVIAKAAGCLEKGGLFIAHLDLANFRFSDGRPAKRTVAAELRRKGLVYDSRRRLVKSFGPRSVEFRLKYLGADDTVGPNYTGQPAVDSYYAVER